MNAALSAPYPTLLEIPGTILPAWAAPVRKGPLVLDDLPNVEYHGTYALVSKSALDVFGQRTPAHYEYMLAHGLAPEDEISESERQRRDKDRNIGSVFHCLVLEPHNFRRDFVELPDFGDMRSSKNRDLRDGWLANEAAGRTPIRAEWLALAREMRESIYRHRRIRRILENGRPEVTCAVLDPHTGLPRKIRIDWLSELEGTILDLKSARDASREAWRREAGQRRYHVQDTYYVDTANLCGLDVDTMGFAIAEKEAPFLSVLRSLDETARLAGETEYMRDLEALATCCRSGVFPGYGEDAQTIDLPPWTVAAAATVT